ncbi:ATP-binding cassette G family transporter ABCG107 [Toxoplasma gondii TgCatPRC2]|uniref:ATP-binding cassette G family transporter ABCG107 n=1 Tax=Toxoplasma gondii TgCatPRC2 TaxID=1130821 RepID=A0A151HG38_TOXGO|nr:ATP-binding cassette G family transporter ABCG107 [Toxoplasma gondii TgCatPRC2]
MDFLRRRDVFRSSKDTREKQTGSSSPSREGGSSSLFSPAGGLHVTPARPITLVARGFSYAVRMKPQIPCTQCASPCLPRKKQSSKAEDANKPSDENEPFAAPSALRRPESANSWRSKGGRADSPAHGALDIEKGSEDQHIGDCATENRTPEERSADGETETEGPLKIILKDINLCARPGEMLVIMGPSGSGKTTLLNAFAGRSPPSSRVVQDGSLLYLGLQPGEPLSSIATYVMQKDMVPELLTVQEYVTFFSRLKMRDATEEERAERVEVVLRELGLWGSRFTRVGGSAKKGLSGGEIKRLALAVELLHNPSLIFLDEPTSGLDAALAFETMKLLLRLARHGGRTILCTIHQPRSQLFAMFDRLVLMFEGRIVFQGPARHCVSYFAKRGFHCPPQFNPADFILDLLNVTTLTANTPLACPQSEGSLSAQSLLEAELKKVQTQELQRLALATREGSRHGGLGEPQEAPRQVGELLEPSASSDGFTPGAERPQATAAAGTDAEETRERPERDGGGPMGAAAGRAGDQEEETGPRHEASPAPLARHRSHGQESGASGRRRRGNDEGDTPGGSAQDGSVEGRKVVSVVPIVSAPSSEVVEANGEDAGGARAAVSQGDARDKPRQSRLQGEARIASGFLDAEETQGELHRVLVDENDVKRLADSYAASPERAHVEELIVQCLQAAPPDHVKPSGRAAAVKRLLPQRRWSDWGREICVLIQMGFLNHVRNPMSSVVQLALNILFGLIFGAIFFNIPGQGQTIDSARNMLGCLFFLGSQLIFGPLDCLVLFCTNRELFNRDTANGNYTPFSYFVAKCLSNLPFEHLPLTCVTLVAYGMCGLHRGAAHFFIYFVTGQLSIFASTSLLGLISAASPRVAVAQAVAPIILLIFLLVTGYYIRADDIPAVIRWLKYLSPIHYSYVALALNQFPPDEKWGDSSNKDFLESYGGITKTDLGFYIGMLALLGCVCRVLSFFCLKYMHRRIGLEA